MRSVTELAKYTGVSVRTLHHYDAIGLLKPTRVTESGYRYYDDAALERLYLILLFRELEFPLKDIGAILDAPDFDRNRILDKQIALLEEKRQHLGTMATMARGLQQIGVKHLELEGFQVKKLKDYSAQAKALYGKTDAYKEYTQKAAGRTPEQDQDVNSGLMDHFVRLGQMKDLAPDSPEVQAWVKGLQDYITANYYRCTNQILLGLGQMYAGGGEMTENIDAAGGPGTGAFACQAIMVYSN